MKLKHIADFNVNNPEADFWIIRKGSENTVGTPTREFSPEHIGVTVTRPDLVIPDYLFYMFKYFAQLGLFSQLAHGTTNLKNISIKDVKNVPIRTA
jgi:restriction endonuclease S subunit